MSRAFAGHVPCSTRCVAILHRLVLVIIALCAAVASLGCNGVIGDASAATAEAGEALLARMVTAAGGAFQRLRENKATA